MYPSAYGMAFKKFGPLSEAFDMSKVVFISKNGNYAHGEHLFTEVKSAGFSPIVIENDKAFPKRKSSFSVRKAKKIHSKILRFRMAIFNPKVVIWSGEDLKSAHFYNRQARKGKTVLLIVSPNAKASHFPHAAAVFSDSESAARYLKSVGGMAAFLNNMDKAEGGQGSCLMPIIPGMSESNCARQIRLEEAAKQAKSPKTTRVDMDKDLGAPQTPSAMPVRTAASMNAGSTRAQP